MPLVVIDPGHGGRDPGAAGNGYQEKNLVLQTSLLLRDALQRCGFRVIMTRTTDTLPDPDGTIGQDLAYRASIANNAKADLYISWHTDAASSAAVNGSAVWIHPSTRGGRTNQWAERIAAAIASSTGQTNRGVYFGDFQVLRDTVMDAVLVEAGFITNAAEARRMATRDYQIAAAEGAARGVCAIFDLPYNAPARPTPQPGTPSTPTPVTPPKQPEVLPAWAEESIRQVIEWGVMTGYEDGTWRPEQAVTRAEMASVLVRFYNFIRSGR
ncbi:N-acetylmuramoyl-L-alanine amidase [Tumebacillus sp. BK434]|uniref:N-acetylmuramoyl-L-alanine amidase n=1 Tax=Tumebacillus sp. BK434 TaxID=2512169 RepID=UPI00104D305F|nr:N-acetylmuramoyl-L-alanine amidase [Tumebacillus sp. BK434]TCP53734.1 N-acetylmuramoyl-L-alanine amidase [Tumebacillus sp. BK434]